MENGPGSATATRSEAHPWLGHAIALSAIAGFIHVLATPSHFEEWVGYGLFFIVAAAAQGLYAVLLLFSGPSRPLLLSGVVGNGLVIALYVITRTVGIPFFGPEAGVVESVGTLDAISKGVEVGLVICLGMMLRALPAGGAAGSHFRR